MTSTWSTSRTLGTSWSRLKLSDLVYSSKLLLWPLLILVRFIYTESTKTSAIPVTKLSGLISSNILDMRTVVHVLSTGITSNEPIKYVYEVPTFFIKNHSQDTVFIGFQN